MTDSLDQVVAALGERVGRVWLPGEPVPKGRPRLGKGGRVFTPDSTRQAEVAIGHRLRRAFPEPLAGPLVVAMCFWRSSRRRADFDNMAKLVLDAGNGIAWHDDAQITDSFLVRRLSRSTPGISMVVGRSRSDAALAAIPPSLVQPRLPTAPTSTVGQSRPKRPRIGDRERDLIRHQHGRGRSVAELSERFARPVADIEAVLEGS